MGKLLEVDIQLNEETKLHNCLQKMSDFGIKSWSLSG